MYLIAGHPDVQQQIFEEVSNAKIFTDGMPPATLAPPSHPRFLGKLQNFSDLGNLRYLIAVINETLRMYPIGAKLYRKIAKNLKGNNVVLPAGACVTVWEKLGKFKRKYRILCKFLFRWTSQIFSGILIIFLLPMNSSLKDG